MYDFIHCAEHVSNFTSVSMLIFNKTILLLYSGILKLWFHICSYKWCLTSAVFCSLSGLWMGKCTVQLGCRSLIFTALLSGHINCITKLPQLLWFRYMWISEGFHTNTWLCRENQRPTQKPRSWKTVQLASRWMLFIVLQVWVRRNLVRSLFGGPVNAWWLRPLPHPANPNPLQHPSVDFWWWILIGAPEDTWCFPVCRPPLKHTQPRVCASTSEKRAALIWALIKRNGAPSFFWSRIMKWRFIVFTHEEKPQQHFSPWWFTVAWMQKSVLILDCSCVFLRDDRAFCSHFESRRARVEDSQLCRLSSLTLTALIHCYTPQAINYRA